MWPQFVVVAVATAVAPAPAAVAAAAAVGGFREMSWKRHVSYSCNCIRVSVCVSWLGHSPESESQ